MQVHGGTLALVSTILSQSIGKEFKFRSQPQAHPGPLPAPSSRVLEAAGLLIAFFAAAGLLDAGRFMGTAEIDRFRYLPFSKKNCDAVAAHHKRSGLGLYIMIDMSSHN